MYRNSPRYGELKELGRLLFFEGNRGFFWGSALGLIREGRMAVQAQYPATAFMPDFRSRARADPVARDSRNYVAVPGSGVPSALPEEIAQLQPTLNGGGGANLFRVSNSAAGFNIRQQMGQLPGGAGIGDPESELTCNNMSGSRKRSREEEILIAQRQQLSQLMSLQKNGASLVSLPQSPGLVFTGLQLNAYNDDGLLNHSAASTSGRCGISGSALVSLLGDALAAQMQEQREEIDQFVKLQSEKLRIALEEKRQRHSRALVAALEEGIVQKMKEKEADLDKLSRRNVELEERVQQLSMESQIWQKIAKDNETLVNSLRSNLEHLVAQSREQQSREGWGDSEVDDAESCCHDAQAHAQAVQENARLKEQRICRVCRSNTSCILLLPCRHLCVCKQCEGALDACPLCTSMKNASVQVYLS